jgi:hypothetical protein
VNAEVNEVVAEVLENFNQTVKPAQAKQLLQIMCRHFKFFKCSFVNLVDKILVLEEKDQLIKSLYSLIYKFFGELSKQQDKLNGSKCYRASNRYR